MGRLNDSGRAVGRCTVDIARMDSDVIKSNISGKTRTRRHGHHWLEMMGVTVMRNGRQNNIS